MKLQEIQAKLEERGETELVAAVQEITAKFASAKQVKATDIAAAVKRALLLKNPTMENLGKISEDFWPSSQIPGPSRAKYIAAFVKALKQAGVKLPKELS